MPEAQLDRFLFKFKIGYPSLEEELEVLNRVEKTHPIQTLEPVLFLTDLLAMQEEVTKVYVSESVKKYIIELVNATRDHRAVYLGASPRAAIALMKAGQASAFMQGRDFVLPDDIKYLAPFALSHRLLLHSDAKLAYLSNEKVIEEILAGVSIPVGKEKR